MLFITNSMVVVDKNNKMTGILTEKDIFNAIYKNPGLFSEFYGDDFSSNFKAVYEKFNEYRLENLMPEFKQYWIEDWWVTVWMDCVISL